MTYDEIYNTVRRNKVMQAMTPQEFKELVNAVHLELCCEFPLHRQTFLLPITIGVKSYSIDQSIKYVMQVRYRYAVTELGFDLMMARHREEVVNQDGYALHVAQGSQPQQYFIDNGQITILEKPAVGTNLSTMLPIIEIDASVFIPMGPEVPLSPQLKNLDIYIYSIFVKYLEQNLLTCESPGEMSIKMAALQEYRKLKDAALHELQVVLTNRADQYTPRFMPRSELFRKPV